MTLKLPHTGQAVITDLGDEVDIHPTPSSRSASAWPCSPGPRIYGEKIEYSGPVFKEQKVRREQGRPHLHPRRRPGGQEPGPDRARQAQGMAHQGRDGQGADGLHGLREDKKFHNAKAVIDAIKWW